MIIIKIIFFTILIGVLCYLSGSQFIKSTYLLVGLPYRMSMKLFCGFILFILSGVIASCIGAVADLGFKPGIVILCIVWIIVVLLLGVMGRGQKLCYDGKSHNSKMILAFQLVLLAITAIQLVGVCLYSYNQIEATRSIYIATSIYDGNPMYKGLSIMNMWGIASSLMNVHPLVFIYTVLPISMISFYYIGYYEVLMSMWDDDKEKSLISLIVVMLLQIWGYQSEKLLPVTMLFSWFSGWCFIIHGLLPFVLMMWLYYRKKHPKAIKNTDEVIDSMEEYEDYQEEWDMKKHKIINARNLAIALGVLAVLLVAFVFILNNKINTLYESTVSLQEDLNNRCAIYEFSPNGSTVEGYLIKGTDGSLTMIGGGKSEYGESLYDFINQYGDGLDNWYLYGIDEDNIGGYSYCALNSGMSVDNVYVLNRTDIGEFIK